MCVCVLQVTWGANGIVLYMYEGNVLMDLHLLFTKEVGTISTEKYERKLEIKILIAHDNCKEMFVSN